MTNKITEIQVVKIEPLRGLVGFASCVYNDSIFLGGIGIYTRPEGGFRLTYPTRKLTHKGVTIFYPINKEVGKEIEDSIINKYLELM